MEATVNKWDKNVPVEKSSYITENKPVFGNLAGLQVPSGAPTMIDLFCGAGGFSVGAGWTGFFPVLGIDHLAPAIKTWAANHPGSISCFGDIRQTDAVAIKQLLNERGVAKIDLLVGGVPCQGFSRANRKHNDDDQRNFLFREYLKFVRVFTPDYIILENVSGMRSTAGGKFESEIAEEMAACGYNVTIKLVNAVEYGVPQHRQRLIFVGVHQCRGLASNYEFPVGNHVNPQDYRTVGCAISDLPGLGNGSEVNEYHLEPQTDYQRLMRGEGNIAIPKPARLNNHISPKHPLETIDKIANTPPGMPMYPNFKQRIRLAETAPSPTQLAGGIRPQFQFGHPNQPRGLSIRERARIQSFPDSFTFHGGTVQERVLTGNAVPPLLIHELTKPIFADLIRDNGD